MTGGVRIQEAVTVWSSSFRILRADALPSPSAWLSAAPEVGSVTRKKCRMHMNFRTVDSLSKKASLYFFKKWVMKELCSS